MYISANNSSAVFAALCEVVEDQANDLEEYGQLTDLLESDDKQEGLASVMNIFVDTNGLESTVKMTYFISNEIKEIFDKYESLIFQCWNKAHC